MENTSTSIAIFTARTSSLIHRLAVIAFVSVAMAAGQNAFARTIVVHSTADDGPGSLRRALVLASNGDTINIVAKGTITLTSGELLVNKSLTIRGPDPHGIVSGNATSRIFHVTPGTTVTISGLTITNGSAVGPFPADAGGGIYNDHAKLTVTSCVLSGNSASYGGGIFNFSDDGAATPLTINNSTLSNNSAVYGAGIYNAGGGTAIMTLTNSTLKNNLASFRGGGIYNDGENGGNAIVTVTNSTISGNSAIGFSVAGMGGGIYNDGEAGSATLALTNSAINGNSAVLGGGIFNVGSFGSAILTITDSTVNENSGLEPYGGGRGVGLYNVGYYGGNASATLINSTVNGNSTHEGFGVGICNESGAGNATLILTNSAVSGNSGADIGGGIYNVSHADETNTGSATVTLDGSIVSDNSARLFGGGIVNSAASSDGATALLTLNNSTVSNNSSHYNAGGISNSANSGTAYVKLTNSTVSENSAIFDGGISNFASIDSFIPFESSGTATVALYNSTVSGNSADHFGAGIGNGARQGGSARILLNNSTVSGNTANEADGASIANGVDLSFGNASATLDIANTILNAGPSGPTIVNGQPATVTSHGYNLSSDAASGDNTTGPGGLLNGPGDIRNTNPLLGPLQNNGGPTLTHALLLRSPAINVGDPSFNPYLFNPPLLYDQRGPGFPRIVNGRVDIGAFESKYRHP